MGKTLDPKLHSSYDVKDVALKIACWTLVAERGTPEEPCDGSSRAIAKMMAEFIELAHEHIEWEVGESRKGY